MNNTERSRGTRRPIGRRIRPSFDRMEARLALSGPGASLPSNLDPTSDISGVQGGVETPIAAVDPAPGSVVEVSPRVLTVTFDRPINSFSLGVADFLLVRLADDGSTSPVSASDNPLGEESDPDDPSGARVLLTPAQPLADGTYRLLLAADNSLLTDEDLPVTTGGANLQISTFTVGQPSSGVITAVDLGQASPTEASTDGVLDPPSNSGAVSRFKRAVVVLDSSSNSGGVSLYRLSVPAGHRWRLGLAVAARDGGGPFPAVLSLFDARGNLIATTDAGLDGTTGDPVLFAGVSPGTYLVGVSGSGNVPGQPNGYDPAKGTAGASAGGAIGGLFRLSFVADPADQPTLVTGLRVDRDDPHSTVATGLTIQFSGSIRVDELLKPGSPSLVLVDASGATWGVTPIGYDVAQARLSLLFDRALPPGHYSLEVAEGGRLVDLAGQVPEAPGLSAGLLGTFEVTQGTTEPDDLGALLPGIAPTGVGAGVDLAAGGSVIKYFRAFQPGIYSFIGVGGSTGLAYSLTMADGSPVEIPPAADGSAEAEGYLLPGSYTLTLTNLGTSEFQGAVTVYLKFSSNSSLLLGGASQGPALNFRLISPTTSLDQGIPSPVVPIPSPVAPISSPVAPISSPVTSVPTLVNDSPSGIYPQPTSGTSGGSGPVGAPNPQPSATSVLPAGVGSGSITVVFSGLVGRPSSATQAIGVVGPVGPSGSVALASNSPGLPVGIVVIPTIPARKNRSPGNLSRLEARTTEIPTDPQVTEAEVAFDLNPQGPDPGADDKILAAAATWIDRVAALGLERLAFVGTRSASSSLPGIEPAEISSEILAEASEAPPESPRVEVASIAPAVGIGVLAMIAYRYWHRLPPHASRARKPETKLGVRPLYRGLHQPIHVLR